MVFCKRKRAAKGRRHKLLEKSFVGQPPVELLHDECRVHYDRHLDFHADDVVV